MNKSEQIKSLYKEEYTRDDFQKEVIEGDIVRMGSNLSVVYNEDRWPRYVFRGFETCKYQEPGHGCYDCQGKILLESIITGHTMGYCSTNQRTPGSALISARWNRNRNKNTLLPDELFEI